MTLYYRWLTSEIKASLPTWVAMRGISSDQIRDLDTRALAVFHDEELVAIAEWYTSKAHASEYWLYIEVAPKRRRQGLGFEVFRLVSRLRHRDIPFTYRNYLHTGSLAFAHKLGAYTRQVVPPDRARLIHREELTLTFPAEALHCEQQDIFQRAYVDMYEWTHELWAPVSGEHQLTLQRDALEDIDKEATSIVYSSSGSIEGFVATYIVDGKPLLMGETASRNTPHGEQIIQSCLRRTLDILACRGIEEVQMDGHISDPHWLPNWIRLAPYGEWFTLVTIPPSTEISSINELP